MSCHLGSRILRPAIHSDKAILSFLSFLLGSQGNTQTIQQPNQRQI